MDQYNTPPTAPLAEDLTPAMAKVIQQVTELRKSIADLQRSVSEINIKIVALERGRRG